MNETASLVFILVGISFDLFGCIGLIRLPDVYNRLQASTKCVTLGTCGILFGVFLRLGFSAGGVKALICIVFVLLTAPVAAHALAKGAHKYGVKLWERSVCDKYTEDKK
ncbi:MAG: monovalent cation/H(+) antiporter subunit G [Candidatus Omnitrophica bacterium]|nr:monovalent cation/H(+) antiporter subunit G [Candidatus Omnitrophota bacterium]MDD5552328.1 monovalent cation/H(+) antiporter subunit G [Candidatus Omnitrophota bacterium]